MRQLDTDEIQIPAWAVYKDVALRDEMYVSSYSNELLAKADRFESKVEEVFLLSPIYRNYRKNFIAIKVSPPISYKPSADALAELDALATLNGIAVLKTHAAARIYRIPRI